MNTKYLG